MDEDKSVIRARLFGPVADAGSVSDESVLVLSSSPDVAARGLAAAVGRLTAVAEDGQELTEEQAFQNSDLYTPNWVSAVYRTSLGPGLLIDCKGHIPEAMATTMTRVLIEELVAAGLEDAELVSWPEGLQPGPEWAA